MNTGSHEELKKLEEEFLQETRGEGSLSPHVGGKYVGYDVHTEDVEALFFDGIGIPRWASIEAANVDEQNAIYMERYNAIMAKFPMLGRSNDTFVGSAYTADEVNDLLAECRGIIESASDPKAVRATQKFVIAAQRAVEEGSALNLKPSAQ